MGRAVNITVILCTYNRCRTLPNTLSYVAASQLPESVEWEVLVVDNNSSDQTRDVVEEFCSRYPGRFRYASEPHPGKSFALNTGIREARGDVLAFVDDDVAVGPSWLHNLTASLRGGEYAGAGGRILPAEAFTPPNWLALDGPYAMAHVFCAYFDLGHKACELDRPPYGANMAFRKKMFEKYGLFRTDLGPSPNPEIPRPNEDTEFGRRLIAAGERLWYEPSAVIYHPAPENRIQKDYFLTWWFDLGRASVREWGRGPSVLGIPRPYLNILKLGTIAMAQRVGRWMLALSPPGRFHYKCLVWATAGQIKEYYRLLRTTAPKGNGHPG